MEDQPREQDVEASRQRQLQEPYPYAAQVLDQIVAEKRAASPAVVNASE
ncbi:hypothetical protein NDK47_25745 [Brevibacillus ruminantium]|uniref:Uncharacterized protein n=1 Tax=Brevibacillus ruminantium TaxID=2950604 RepID=A0ABY4WH54_9BACL|nr:hypothetical protein [Brevibacillus ruminantium]USG65468.1 hypothetical protein NDK47_25745 [Brevibacillus ruminantium]